jgi:hypothetical protein
MLSCGVSLGNEIPHPANAPGSRAVILFQVDEPHILSQEVQGHSSVDFMNDDPDIPSDQTHGSSDGEYDGAPDLDGDE